MKVHDDSKCFKCDVCLKVFPTNSLLKIHYRTHTGEKPFACQICDKRFAHKCTLVKHQATHTRAKPFAFQICGKKFARKGDLVQHQATHSDVRNFKCSICPDGRFFKTKSQLSHHMVFHYEPKYSCSHCDHKSYTKMSLKKHTETHFKN